MTTIQLDRPAPQAPADRSWWVKADLAARIVLLAVIGLGWLSMLPVHLAASRPATQFTTDLGSHKVTSIRYDQKTRSLRWHDGGIRWYAADLKLGRPAVGPSPDGLGVSTSQVEGDNTDNAADRAWLTRAVDAAGLRRRLDLVDSSDMGAWVSPVPWRGLPLAAGIAAILSFFLMLGRDRRRFGTRWAWLWMFALVGWGIAPALSLLLEPAPLWLRKARPMPVKPAFTGLAV
ncbi:MAG: hypothetical protein QOI76_11, partial [Frankiales bacterium]|nr:hypothetical protein [Frankiales bacterium]